MAREDARDVIERYNRAKQARSNREQQWRMNSAYCMPRDYEKWSSGNTGNSDRGTDADFRARFAFDNTGVKAVPKYKAICKRLINPEGVKYHAIAADDDKLMRVPAVRMWCSDVTSLLFNKRHNFASRFGTAQLEMYGSIGVYGNGVKTTLWGFRKNVNDYGLMYKSWPMYNIYWLVDDMGYVTDVFRRMWLTKRQFELWKPEAPLPRSMQNVAKGAENDAQFEFVHAVSYRNKDYDEKALNAKRFKWQSCYVCVNDAEYVGDEEGFITNPYQISATDTVSGDAYGYSPAEQAFPALGSANAVKKTYIKQGQKAVDPTLLIHDDGMLSGRIDARPGRYIMGGVDSQGRQLVQPLNTGANFQVVKEILADDRNDANDSFLITLFQILTENPEMTAAEVYERIAEKAALFAPTMAALQEQDQGPQVYRELAILGEQGLLPPMPPEMMEAKGEYKLTYSNPMSKAMYAGEVSGFMRWQEMLTAAAANGQDPSIMDNINWDDAAPEIADKMDVRPHWVATKDQIEKKRAARNQAAKQQQMVEAAPAAASAFATMSQQGAR